MGRRTTWFKRSFAPNDNNLSAYLRTAKDANDRWESIHRGNSASRMFM